MEQQYLSNLMNNIFCCMNSYQDHINNVITDSDTDTYNVIYDIGSDTDNVIYDIGSDTDDVIYDIDSDISKYVFTSPFPDTVVYIF